MAIEIVDFPIKNKVIFHGKMWQFTRPGNQGPPELKRMCQRPLRWDVPSSIHRLHMFGSGLAPQDEIAPGFDGTPLKPLGLMGKLHAEMDIYIYILYIYIYTLYISIHTCIVILEYME